MAPLDALSEYEVDWASAHIWLDGLSTPDCIRRVESWLERLEGVQEATVSFPAALVAVRYDRNKQEIGVILDALEKRGYRAALKDTANHSPFAGPDAAPCTCRLAWYLVLPLLGMYIVHLLYPLPATFLGAGALFWALLIAVVPGRGLLLRAARDLRFGFFGGEVLTAAAVLLCLCSSLPALLGAGAIDLALVAAVAIALHLTVLRLVRAAHFKPAQFTSPLAEEGDGAQVDRALASKLPIQRFADQMATVFPPLVLLTALATVLLWGFMPDLLSSFSAGLRDWLPWTPATGENGSWTMGIYCAAGVLLSACPWAMVLAAPQAVRAALIYGIDHGLVFREGALLQGLRDLTNVVFERTSGLTYNAPVVEDLIVMPGVARERLLYWAASAESGLDTPMARAIKAYAESEEVEAGVAETFLPVWGQGLAALVDGQPIVIGRPSFLEEQGVDIRPLDHQLYVLGREGRMPLLVAREKKLLGAIILRDPLRTDSVRVIKILRSMGIWSVLLTGEDQKTAQTIGEQCGIAEVKGDLTHKKKGEAVRRLKKDTIGKIAYVGAAANDKEAWEYADMLVGLGDPGEHHIEVRSKSLKDFLLAVQLGRATYHKIILCAFIAAGYNIVIVPIAMVGLLHPLLAQALMLGVCMVILRSGETLRNFDSEAFTVESLRK